MAPTDLMKVSDEPGHSVTVTDGFESTEAPTAVAIVAPAHPFDDAVDAYAASAKAVRLQKDELTRALADQELAAGKVKAANDKLAELADAESKAFATLQQERDAADLPKALPKSDDSE
jgi:hypothetical protein